MYIQPEIYHITPQHLRDDLLFEMMCNDMQNSYYWSDEWSDEFYVELAKKGFISTTYEAKQMLVLLPELEFDYAVLDFENLHISKKVAKLMRKKDYIFELDKRFDEVVESFGRFHKYNWLKGRYIDILKSLHKTSRDDFSVHSIELCSKDGKQIIAAEVGYITNNIYTSLSGFCIKDKNYNNYGKLQMVLLAQYLEQKGIRFWNLGHPHMAYKLSLGAKIYKRKEFLKRWFGDDV